MKLTSTGKCVFAYILVLLVLGIFLLGKANAGQMNVTVEWSWNGLPSFNATGFRLYQENSEGVSVVVMDIQDPDARSHTQDIEAQVGRSLYYLTAYSDSNETGRSNAYPFEYIEPDTPSVPPPTIIIRFN